MQIDLSGPKIIRNLVVCALFLIFMNGIFVVLEYKYGHDYVFGLTDFFLLKNETNLPTFYSSFILFFTSVLLLMISQAAAQTKAAFVWHWRLLAGIFLYLSIDEFAQIHEHWSSVLKIAWQTHGIFHFAWVIPYGLAVLVLVAAYFKFLRNLPRKTAFGFLLAGFVYVSGAIGMELLEAQHMETLKVNTLHIVILGFIEETLEIAGVLLFIKALLDYLHTTYADLSLKLTRP